MFYGDWSILLSCLDFVIFRVDEWETIQKIKQELSYRKQIVRQLHKH